MKKNTLTALISIVLSLFLAVCLFAAGVSAYGCTAVCNWDVLMEGADDSGYYTQLYGEIRYEWENYLAITGVAEPEPILAVLTPEQVKKDASGYLESATQGLDAPPDTAPLAQALEEKVRSYVYDTVGAESSEELEENIEALVDSCVETYRQYIQIRLLPKILGAVTGREKYLRIGLLAGIGGTVFFGVFLFFLQRKREDMLYYCGISCITCTVLTLGSWAFAAWKQVLSRLPFENSPMKTLMVNYLSNLLKYWRQLGDVYLILSALLVGGYVLLRKRKKA